MSEQHRKSRKQELRGARRFGGRRQPGSGASWSAKGDVRSALALVEYKRTDKRQIIIRAEVLEKIMLEALAEGRIPVLGIELDKKNYVLLAEEDFFEVVDASDTDPHAP